MGRRFPSSRSGLAWGGTIYRHFSSKEDLVNALYQRWKAQVVADLAERLPVDRPIREQFHVFWSRWAGFVTTHPEVNRFLELHHHAPYLDATSRAIEEQLMTLARALFTEAIRQGVLKDVPVDLLIAVVHGVLVGMAKAHLQGRLELTEDVVASAETCWEAIRA
jgi:AcrR family transcriptional regulator